MMSILSNGGEKLAGPDIDVGLRDGDDVAAVTVAENSSSRTATVKRTRRRSQSCGGRSSSSPANKRKYPTNHKRVPFRSRPPTTMSAAPKYQGNYWIRIRPVAAPRNPAAIQSRTKQQGEHASAPFEKRQVASLDNDGFFRFDEGIFRPSAFRGVTKSSSCDGVVDLHAPPPSPLIYSFNSCRRRQPGCTNINPKNARIVFGESGRPIGIRSESGYV
jgi:hypothetical protein